MSEDKDVLIQLTDDEDDNAKAAAEDTARLLIDIHDRRPADDDSPANGGSQDNGSGDDE
ncbi:hypothetical protein [Crateriforma conspicua]|uniref:Uncharacterized protein n=1 Tax=Crateriforma conspicua TaxID=2527996 RepID=A0A5C5YDZ6_9PLAN|nr:hypothetical protein [Crateriforma conspicua]TWT71522.1 hypothetical protein Pan14r_38320 [Crateriforma conspicua]